MVTDGWCQWGPGRRVQPSPARPTGAYSARQVGSRGFPDARPAAEVLADLYAHLVEQRRAG